MLAGMDELFTVRSAPLLVILIVELVLIGWGTGYVSSLILSLVPWRPLSYPFLLPGTVLHELAHAVAALVLGLGIEEMVLFRPTTAADGSVELGWVTPRRSARGRSAVMAVAPLLLVPPTLMALVLLARTLPAAWWGGSAALWIVAALGSLGAFPSSGDRVSVLEALALVGACVLAGLALYGVGGERATSVALAAAVLALLVPAIVFALAFWLKFVRRQDASQSVMVIVIRDRPRVVPRSPAPLWPSLGRPRR
jgi:hypothetical protein